MGDTAVAQRMPRETWGQRCSARGRAQTDMWGTNGLRNLHRAIWHQYNGGNAFGQMRLGGLMCAPVARRMARIETPIVGFITPPILWTLLWSRIFRGFEAPTLDFHLGNYVLCGLGLRELTGTFCNSGIGCFRFGPQRF